MCTIYHWKQRLLKHSCLPSSASVLEALQISESYLYQVLIYYFSKITAHFHSPDLDDLWKVLVCYRLRVQYRCLTELIFSPPVL